MATSESFVTRLLSTEDRRVRAAGLVTLAVAFAVSLFAFFAVIVPAEEREAVERWRDDLDAAVSVREVALENWISDREASARVVARFPSVHALLQGNPESGAPGQLAEILSDLATETSLDAILVIDVSGRLRVVSKRGLPFAEGCADLAIESVARRRSAVVMRSVAGAPRIIVTVPVADRDRPEDVLGATVLVIDPQRWVYPLVSIRRDRRGSVEAFLVDREGDSVRFSSPLLHRPDPPLTFRLPLRTRGLVAASAIDGTRRFSMGTDYDGTLVFAATRRLTNAPWGLVVKVNASDVFEEAVTRARPTGIGLLLASLLLALVAALIARVQGREAREAQDLVRAIVARAPASIHALDREGRVTLWNPASERLFGWSASEVVGSRLPILDKAHEEEFRARFLRTMSGDPPPVGVVRRVKKDGSAIDLLMSVEVLRDRTGAVNGALAVAVDVTESLEHEQRARALFDAGVIGCLFGDIRGGVSDANDAFLELIGYSRDELREGQLRWDTITPAEWLPLDAEKVAEARRLGRCTPYEKEYVRKDGTRVPVLIGYKLLEPERERSVAFILDVSELRRERTARREAESALGALFETPGMPIAIFEVNGDDLLHVDCNAAYADRVGAPVEQVKGRLMGELGIERDRVAPAVARARSIAVSGEPAIYETETARDGRRYVVSMIPLPGGSPERIRVLTVMSDITRLRVAEAELRSLNAELEARVVARTGELLAANRELEAFTYSVSHDLRAPLRAIDGFAEILGRERGDRLDEEGHRLLRIIVNAARNMGQLIDDLLSFSRAGRLTLRRERVPMKALAQAAWADVPADKRRDVTFELAEIPDARGDASLMRQVWHNLLENAVKYSAPKLDRRVEVGVEVVDGRTAWFVRDNGVGFDMKYAETIFGVFQRLHAPHEFEGTGVGLAIVQRIVDRHGGAIWCQAAPGAGATFYFTLEE